jgi:DNA-binding NarL/FixJ family response regulator
VPAAARRTGRSGCSCSTTNEVVRRGLGELLDGEADIEVVGDASTVREALDRGPALRPDVAVLDVRLPDGDGIGVCRELRSRVPGMAALILTSFDDDDALLDAIMAGASGYVLKQIRGSDLVSAVRTVASGQSMLDPATTARLMSSVRGDRPGDPRDEALPWASRRSATRIAAGTTGVSPGSGPAADGSSGPLVKSHTGRSNRVRRFLRANRFGPRSHRPACRAEPRTTAS